MSSLMQETFGPASMRARTAARLSRALVRPPLVALSGAAGLVEKHGPGIDRIPVPYGIVDRAGAFLPAPRGTATTPIDLGTCRAERVRARGLGPSERAILYFHGGMFIAGGLRTHRRMVARLSAAARAEALNVGYRMLPRHTIADAIADGVAGYRQLLADGYQAGRIIVAGDSAGGFLSLAVTRAVLDMGLPRPAGVIALSPLTDLDCTAKLAHPNRHLDPFIPITGIATVVQDLAPRLDPAVVELSPVNAHLADFPPALIQVGSTECLRPDSELMAIRLAEAGVPCRLQIWDRQLHVFPFLADVLPEGAASMRVIGKFIDAVIESAATRSTVAPTPTFYDKECS